MNGALVLQKLDQIRVCLAELGPVARVPLGEFRSRPAHYRLAERDVQLAVDSAVRINNHLIIEAGRVAPPSYFDSFVALSDLRVLPRPLALRLARTTGLRNRIVHEYESVDLRLLHRALPGVLRDYRSYIGRIRSLLGP